MCDKTEQQNHWVRRRTQFEAVERGDLSHRTRPNRLWSPLTLTADGYLDLFPQGQNGRRTKLITRPYLMREIKLPLPLYASTA